jgi:GNAT superfamily N-acetyltransferase
MPAIEILTAGEHPDLEAGAKAALRAGWPAFVLRDPLSSTYRDRAQSYFPQFAVLLVEDGEVLADARAVPLRWDGEAATLPRGYDGALVDAVSGYEGSVTPDTLCIMAATVLPGRTGGGLAGKALTALRERAAQAGLSRVIAPVRPALKARYPLTSMADFAGWTRDDGLHLDPWVRTHQRLGATILAPAPESMCVPGTVAEWEKWTGMVFPQSGRYVVPGALDLVDIDVEQDRGLYAETNLWMRHS